MLKLIWVILVLLPALAISAQDPTREDWSKIEQESLDQVKRSPERAEGWWQLGWARFNLEKWPEARDALSRAFELGWQRQQTAHTLARVFDAMQRRDEAMAWFERACELGHWSDPQMKPEPLSADFKADRRYRKLLGLPETEPNTRTDRWLADIDYLVRCIERIHYGRFGNANEKTFRDAVAELKQRVTDKKDHEITAELTRLVASLGDGHSRLFIAGIPGYFEPVFEKIEFQFSQLSDGLIVTAAPDADKALLGTKLIAIGGKTLAEVRSRLRPYASADNEMGVLSAFEEHIRLPALLHAAGLTESPDQAPLEFESYDGGRHSRVIGVKDRAGALRRLDDGLPDKPRWLKRKNEPYWFEALPEAKAIFFQFNSVSNAEPESFADFCARLFDEARKTGAQRLIVDLRHNGGGDNTLLKPLVHGLIRHPELARKGSLFVLIGRETFSAAMNCVTELERHAEPTFVGEPTGSSPNHVGEFNLVRLPYSGVCGSLASLYWQGGHATDTRTWVAPHIPAPFSALDLREGRDPGLEAILRQIQPTSR